MKHVQNLRDAREVEGSPLSETFGVGPQAFAPQGQGGVTSSRVLATHWPKKKRTLTDFEVYLARNKKRWKNAFFDKLHALEDPRLSSGGKNHYESEIIRNQLKVTLKQSKEG